MQVDLPEPDTDDEQPSVNPRGRLRPSMEPPTIDVGVGGLIYTGLVTYKYMCNIYIHNITDCLC